MTECAFLKKFKEAQENPEILDRVLDQLRSQVRPLLIADDIKDMFRQDIEDIKYNYHKDILTMEETIESLKKLEEISENIDKPIAELREMIEHMKSKTRSFFENQLDPHQRGIPIREVILDIKKDFDQALDEIKMKDFGFLEIHEMEETEEVKKMKKKVVSFVKNYKAGILVLPEQQKDLIDEAFDKTRVSFELKEMSKRIVCTFENSE